MSEKAKKTTSANITGMQPPVVKGIKDDRERPARSGWCGNENCKHLTHKHFNEAAKAVA
jgi:hypothetical protein